MDNIGLIYSSFHIFIPIFTFAIFSEEKSPWCDQIQCSKASIWLIRWPAFQPLFSSSPGSWLLSSAVTRSLGTNWRAAEIQASVLCGYFVTPWSSFNGSIICRRISSKTSRVISRPRPIASLSSWRNSRNSRKGLLCFFSIQDRGRQLFCACSAIGRGGDNSLRMGIAEEFLPLQC